MQTTINLTAIRAIEMRRSFMRTLKNEIAILCDYYGFDYPTHLSNGKYVFGQFGLEETCVTKEIERKLEIINNVSRVINEIIAHNNL